MAIHSDNYWLSRLASGGSAIVEKSIAFDGTSGLGKILTAATDTVTIDGVDDGDTLTIDGVTYTFQTSLVDTANNVLIGVSDATALDNLKSAINASAGAGTTYGTATVAHPSVNATTNTDTTQVIAADTSGSASNSIAVSASDSSLVWTTPTLTGGSDGTISLFTAIGDSLVALIITCSEDLAGASATFEIGVSGATAKFIPQTTATNLDVGENVDITGIVAPGTALVTTPNQVVFNGQTVILTVGTASITNGTIKVYAFYKELSPTASVDRV